VRGRFSFSVEPVSVWTPAARAWSTRRRPSAVPSPAPVQRVDDRERELRAGGPTRPRVVAPDGDDVARGVDRHDRDMVVLVDLGQEPQVARGQLRLRAEEAPPARLRAHATEEVEQARLVLGRDRPHAHPPAAGEREQMSGGGHDPKDAGARAGIPAAGMPWRGGRPPGMHRSPHALPGVREPAPQHA
jgi:hypothetical protein